MHATNLGLEDDAWPCNANLRQEGQGDRGFDDGAAIRTIDEYALVRGPFIWVKETHGQTLWSIGDLVLAQEWNTNTASCALR